MKLIMKKLCAFMLKTSIGIGFMASGQFLSKENAPVWQFMVVYIIGFMLMDIWSCLDNDCKG